MRLISTRLGERAGTVAGWIVAPLFALTTTLRRARTFHPTGLVFAADVTPAEGAVGAGERLRGHALVRFSSALWKGRRELLDALGCAVRFRHAREPSSEPGEGDQDLLFATIRHPWTTLLAPLTTDVHDFLANDYYAVSPFDVPGLGRARLRLRAERRAEVTDAPRAERLFAAVARGGVRLHLEARAAGERAWRPVAVVTLREAVDVDQERLAFSPFRAGRGFVPRGFVHALRRGVYALSQRARGARRGLRLVEA